MSDPKQEQKERDWADREAEESETDDPRQDAYRDGSAVNECWKREDV